MSLDSNLGIPLSGGMLQRVPSEANKGEQTAALNNVIDRLNTWNGVIVRQGTIDVPISANAQSVSSIPHGLNYAPVPVAFLNGVGISLTGSTTLNIPLPTWLSVSIDTTNQIVNQSIMMNCMADETNFYVFTLNATGVVPSGSPFQVTYYLSRIQADK